MNRQIAVVAAWAIATLLLVVDPVWANDAAGIGDLNRQSVRLYNAGNHTEGIAVSRRAVKLAREVLPKEHSEMGNALNNLGSHLRASGDPGAAAEPFREAFILRQKALGPYDPVTLDTQLSLGFTLNLSGQTQQAREVLANYVALYTARGRENHSDTHNAREVLASIAVADQDWQTAIDHYRVLVEIRDSIEGADAEKTALFLNNLGALLARIGKAADGVPYIERAVRLRTALLAPSDQLLIDTRLTLAFSRLDAGEATEALAEFEKLDDDLVRFGSDTRTRALVAKAIGDLARRNGNTEKAVERLRQTAILRDQSGDPNGEIEAVQALAETLREAGRLTEEAETRRKLLPLISQLHGANSGQLASEQESLAEVLDELGLDEEAVALYRTALAIHQTANGVESPEVGGVLTSVGYLLEQMGRAQESLPILERAVAIFEKSHGSEHVRTLTARNNLAITLWSLGRADEAIAIHREVLEISQRVRGADHPETSKSMNNLALALESAGRMEEAREVFRQALEIDERTSGAIHSNTAVALANYASSLRGAGDLFSLAKAKLHYRRALDIYGELYGKEHIKNADIHSDLGTLEAGVGNHHGAREHFMRASEIFTNGINRVTLGQRRFNYVNAVASSLGNDQTDFDETFRLVQWPMRDSAGGAIDAMAVRAAADNDELRNLVRRKQDLLENVAKLDEAFTAALSGSDAGQTDQLRLRHRALNRELEDLEGDLAQRFPQFESLTGAKPLSAKEVADLLRPGEGVIVLSPGHYTYGNPVAGSVHLVRHDGRTKVSPLEAGRALVSDFSKLRCSFLPESCSSAMGEVNSEETRGARGAISLGPETPKGGFDADLAHRLYKRLFEPVEDMLDGLEHLIIVTDHDGLAGIPLQVLLRSPLESGDLADAHWLIRDFALSSLPNVEALKAIRGLSGSGDVSSRPTRPFLGIGDPIIGTAGPMECTDEPVAVAALDDGQSRVVRAAGGALLPLFRSSGEQVNGIPVAVASTDAVRQLARLPDTRCELQQVSDRLGGGDLLLDLEATEASLKSMSEQGRLRDYRIVSFATHGLVTGEAGAAEPALVLTPPAEGTPLDDGLLTASEVAALDLNAEWVLLSACNTAAGGGRDGESLSGLARAFFYAGARSLLVSHWPVSSPAAVRLTTRAFAEMEANPHLGRAQAMRRSMLAMLDDPQASAEQRDPSYWAPFSVVGEGGPIVSQ